MMTDEQLIARLLELQEHPELVTDEQLGQLLQDEQMRELVEQMAFAKRAFMHEESKAGELPIADEWEKFAASHAEELIELEAQGQMNPNPAVSRTKMSKSRLAPPDEDMAQPHTAISMPSHPLRKMAASWIGIILASGIALAAFHIVRRYQAPELPQATGTTAEADAQRPAPDAQPEETDSLAAQPRIFDNVPLDTMLLEMADYYHVGVEFEREESRRLRFHFVWKSTDDLDRLVEKLNNFEAVNIIREPQKLIVR